MSKALPLHAEKLLNMGKTQTRIKRFLFVLLLALFVAIMVVILFFDPGDIIMHLGVHNSLVIVFFVSLAGAFTSLTPLSAYPMLFSLIAGEMAPLLAGLTVGLGMAAGDVLFFMFGNSARGLTGARGERVLGNILNRVQRFKNIYIQLLIIFYVACTPFPNNLLSGALAFIGYPLRKVFLPLVLGDIAFAILMAWLSHQGLKLF